MSDLRTAPHGHLDADLFEAFAAVGMQAFYHRSDRGRDLFVLASTDHYDLYEAFALHFGVRDWRHVSVSVKGQLQARLADQRRIGRQRAGGERSPAPLPDWYELTHLAYAHAAELGFDPTRGVYQYLPAPGESKLNIAEALHLLQAK